MLEKIHFDEAKQSQLTAIEMLVALGWEYISSADALKERSGDTRTYILSNIAAKKLMEINSYEAEGVEYKFSEKDVRDAIYDLEHVQYEGLIDTSQNIYNMIMPTSGGRTIRVNVGGKNASKNFRYIDFRTPENNSFHVTAEFVASGKGNIRPDIVCFVNGIPLAVIENKKSSVAVTEAIHQMNRNQGVEFCPKLFTFTQVLAATNGKEFLYGTTGTPAKFYAVWKEKGKSIKEIDAAVLSLIGQKIDKDTYNKILSDLNGQTNGYEQKLDRLPTEQDRGLALMFKPERLLDLSKNYILYDAGVKKLSRYQQYFAIRKMIDRIFEYEEGSSGLKRRKGGLLWHTQGSGKSLTMVMFVKALIEHPNITNPRVLIVTDRKDLDRQIKGTFQSCNLKKEVIQAKSGIHLLDLIKENNLAVITTIIDKFDSASKKRAGFVDEDQDIFVLIDEAHRSQSGIANLEMNRIIPSACYIGFTGTPLMKSEKESWRKFGGYIDKYTIDDALEDKIILPLIYEGRYVDLVQNEEQVDKHLARITEGLSKEQKKELQKYIGTKIIKDNPQRIVEIAYDIEKHFLKHFKDTGLKGQIVAPSKFSAVIFQRFFSNSGKINTAVVISDEHEDGNEANSHRIEVVNYLDGVRENHRSVSKYGESVIESFKNYDDGVEIVIVVDKLLTGFDAPRNTILYLAKDLRDHNLLQAIARVNRLYENKKLPKTSGYIVDYSENAKNIDTAMKLFGNYDEEDVKSSLIDVSEKINELEESYSKIHDMFKGLHGSTDDEAFVQALKDEPSRELFYKALSNFIKILNECCVLQEFVHEFKHLDTYKKELKKLIELRKTVNLKYADRVDLEEYKLALVQILDKYVDARGVELLTKQINITDRKQFQDAINELGSDKSKAEAIAAQTEKTISEKMESDPEFYERFSKKISEILKDMREGKLADIEAFKQLKLISEDVIDKKDDELPEEIVDNEGSDIFYRNLRDKFGSSPLEETHYVEIIVEMFSIIKKQAIVDWNKNIDVKRRMMNALDDYLYDVVKKEKKIEISNDSIKEIISKTLSLAENNYEVF